MTIASLKEVTNGIQQFGRTEDPVHGPIHPLRELVWLTRRAVSEDMNLNGDAINPMLAAKMHLMRLREIGAIFTEIFAFREYEWQPSSQNPRIIDLGGDIGGFTILYWKSVAPQAKITLVEANPATANVIASNLKRKGLNDVEVINAAASDYNGKVDLYLSGYNPSNFAGEREDLDTNSYHKVSVPTIKVSDIIGCEKVDLLKMDVEGMEGKVLRELEASGSLALVDEIMMEFHNSPSNPENSLQEVLSILAKAGFVIENAHVSGMERLRRLKRIETIDIYSVKPTDKVLFSFTARKSQL